VSFRPAHLLLLGVPAALVAATLVAVTGSSSSAQPEPRRVPLSAHKTSKPEFEPNAVMVKFKKSASTTARKAAVSKLRTTADSSVTGDIVKLTGEASAADLLKKAKADPAVELASLNYRRQASATPSDYYYANYQKANLTGARVPEAWDLSKSTGNQIVAVLDTGVDAGHPDLVGHLVTGYNATSPNRGPIDDNGHGTMTLGIIAAAANNGMGVAGVGWSAKAMPVKVLAADGGGYDVDIAEGIDWAVAHGAKVINMSLGGPGDNPVLHDAVKRAVNVNNVVVIAAAGNDGNNTDQYPAAYPEVVAVAATTANGTLTDFSSFGSWVDVAAPGVDILSTYPRYPQDPDDVPYAFCTGTSCSSPIVAGIAAMVRNKWPTFTSAQVAQRLKVLSRDAGPRGTDPYYGAGIVDAYAALGGKVGADFAGGAADGNDQPARAVKVTAGTPASGVINTEGDVDWYAVDSAAARTLRVSVTGPLFNEELSWTNVGPEIDVYDAGLKTIGNAVKALPEIDPEEGPIWAPLTATADVSAAAGTTYVAVRNNNGTRDSRAYSISITEAPAGAATSGWDYPIRDISPATNAGGVATTAVPTITFARDMDASTVVTNRVRLQNGKTGAVVPSVVSYDAPTRTATITPSAPLLENTTYRIIGEVLNEANGVGLPLVESVFTTVDLVPAKLTTFAVTGAFKAASVAWTIPATPDLDQVIIRQNVGGKAPTLTTGTLVYAGTGTSVKVTGLASATTYTYAGWVKDRAGKIGPISAQAVNGVKSAIATTATAINYGGTITLKGSVLRIDNKAFAGLPVQLYGRAKNVAALKLITTLKTGSTGSVSYAVKPATSSVYTMVFVGNSEMMGTRTADISVAVAPTVSSVLSPTAIKLGKTTKFSGYVAPAHSGKLVYLQFYSAKTWRNIASVKLTASGAYAFGIKPAARGSFAYRVLFTADADHAQALSPQRIVKVS
jgi:subtilisin family serine protease